jgi:hypothetical protein
MTMFYAIYSTYTLLTPLPLFRFNIFFSVYILKGYILVIEVEALERPCCSVGRTQLGMR